MAQRSDNYYREIVALALNPQTITGNSTTNGNTIDTQGFESVSFTVITGNITDGTVTPKLQHGDQSNLSDAADVSASDMVGSFTAIAATDDNKAYTVNYIGGKRYVRVVLTQTGATSGGIYGAVVRKGAARHV